MRRHDVDREGSPFKRQNLLSPKKLDKAINPTPKPGQKHVDASHLERLQARGYRLDRIIARSSNSFVYKGFKGDEQVAIKYVKEIGDDQYKTHALLREINILRQLSELDKQGRRMARLKDVVGDVLSSRKAEISKGVHKNDDSTLTNKKGFVFLILEYVEGKTLKEFQEQTKAKGEGIDTDTLTKIIYNLLGTLAFIHSAGVMHRDIRPSNILVEPDYNIKLIDFGIARAISQPESEKKSVPVSSEERAEVAKRLLFSQEKRRSKERELSPHVVSRVYRPPEVILLENHYGPPVDIWSFGCIAAELVLITKPLFQPTQQSRFLFAGSSCYPLSPCPQEEAEVKEEFFIEKSDQLRKILEVMGDQSNHDLSFITRKAYIEYVQNSFQKVPKIRFDLEFKAMPKGISKICQHSLEFNPHFRNSARDFLRLGLFDNLRSQEKEEPAASLLGPLPSITVDSGLSFGGSDYQTEEKSSHAEILKLLQDEINVCSHN